MEQIVRVVAPRRWPDFILKSAIFIGLIVAFSLGVEVVVDAAGVDPSIETLLQTVLVAIPFAVGLLALLRSQVILTDRLRQIATTDMLTGLRNRRAFLSEAGAASRLGGTLLILDADHFKLINDTYGHDTGDRCLQAIAQRLASLEPVGALTGRLGGEEFGLFHPRTDGQIAEALGNVLLPPILVECAAPEGAINVTLSIGATRMTPETPLALAMTRADAALYCAKDAGRGCLRTSEDTTRAAPVPAAKAPAKPKPRQVTVRKRAS